MQLFRVVIGQNIKAGWFGARWDIRDKDTNKCIDTMVDDFCRENEIPLPDAQHPHPHQDPGIKNHWLKYGRTGTNLEWNFAFKNFKQFKNVFHEQLCEFMKRYNIYVAVFNVPNKYVHTSDKQAMFKLSELEQESLTFIPIENFYALVETVGQAHVNAQRVRVNLLPLLKRRRKRVPVEQMNALQWKYERVRDSRKLALQAA